MAKAAAETRDIAEVVKSVLRGIWATLLTATLTVTFVISFTTIIYGGSLAPLLETGLGLSLLGAALMCGVGGFFYSFRGTICQPQDVTAIVLAVTVSAMAETWPADQEDSLMATIAVLVALTTAFSGILAWSFGMLRLGFLARFIPYPVIGGFLAATGFLLLMGAISLGLGARVTVSMLADTIGTSSSIAGVKPARVETSWRERTRERARQSALLDSSSLVGLLGFERLQRALPHRRYLRLSGEHSRTRGERESGAAERQTHPTHGPKHRSAAEHSQSSAAYAELTEHALRAHRLLAKRL